ncbi:carboxylating nicotinate-nucleotide diphosphorylase [Candidatus Sulfidibacterium hydrothermale]|uniref:carboxylating nicotinate-nucleotide diphosphorylase n=1 Tax=Candidatus Sulfidibacterium hydrothermale TaxID=2875962 RepID=UPI001F0A4148|nr:carboxylating nicotinate-nucleotide diphosphorylase [Candidatus Sulfidibacterium hydrothermale]UBM61655.1 carboxylating nicotinate-nucleotide diphosphorylase [Candidatus Sulfidibacterium hydrothermale]
MTIKEIIAKALEEDLGNGDHTSLATIDEEAKGTAVMLAKGYGIIAGTEIVREVFELLDPETKIHIFIPDGNPVQPGDKIMTISGKSRILLSGERTALNYIQRMSGIATTTAAVVSKLKGLHTKVLDTRKTTPCNRVFEKMAVKAGGGENHRFGLYDMIMIKDNHIDFAGGIEKAIEKTHQYLKKHHLDLKIEIEVRNFDELEQVLQYGGIHRIMLDNFTPDDIRRALQKIAGKYETEASGGITPETIRTYAETGVDYISMGALTHQIKSMDISLKAIND